jgi:hypothetical protein
MDLNGSNRIEIELPAELSFLPTSGMVAGEKDVYAVAIHTNSQAESQYRLIRIDVENRSVSAIENLDNDKTWFLIGALNGKLLLKNITRASTGSTPEETVENIKNRIHTVALYNVQTSEQQVITQWQHGQMTEIYADNTLYFWSAETNTLHQLDDETYSLNEIAALTFPVSEEYTISPETCAYDGHIIFGATTENGASQRYAYNINTQELLTLTLKIEQRYVGILGESDEYFIVKTSDVERTYSDTASDGSIFENRQLISVFSLIEKSDYWNNIPNYIDIQDLT